MSELELPEFVANDPSPACCKSCGVPFVAHLGVQGTCETLQRVRALLAEWQARFDAEIGAGVATGQAMARQLQAALDGDHIPDVGRKVGE